MTKLSDVSSMRPFLSTIDKLKTQLSSYALKFATPSRRVLAMPTSSSEDFAICSTAARFSREIELMFSVDLTTRSPPRFCSEVAMVTCWVMRFMFSTAPMICLLPDACSFAAWLTSCMIRFMFSTAMRICLPPDACSRTALATCCASLFMFSTDKRIFFASRPLLGRCRYGHGHDLVRFLHAPDDLLERLRRAVGHVHGLGRLFCSGLRAPDRVLRLRLDAADHLADLFCRLHAPFGKFPHFFGHHGKPSACVSGPGRLNGRVQGKQIRLVRYLFDDRDDLADLLGALAKALDEPGHAAHGAGDALHALERPGQGLAARLGLVNGTLADASRLLILFTHLITVRGHLFYARRAVLHHPGQVLGALRHLLDRDRHLLHRGGGLNHR